MKTLTYAVVILAVLLFIDIPTFDNHRLFKLLLNVGHIILFAIAAIILLKKIPRWYSNTQRSQLATIGILSFSCGFFIEVAQSFIGRDFDYYDIFYDVLGGYLGWLLYIYVKPIQGDLLRREFSFALIAVILIIISIPIIPAIYDRYYMQKLFPIIVNFETPFELDRWSTHLAKLRIAENPTQLGQSSLMITFLPGQYPNIKLRDFLTNWQGYRDLKFSIYNPHEKTQLVALKIYDKQHILNNYAYSDRYNKKLTLAQGWNDIEISLDEISTAPKHRKLNLREIANFSIFMIDLKNSTTLYFDDLTLISYPVSDD